MEMHRVLKPTGVIFLHSDWHASHYLKIMLDNVFGPKNFRNEIVWCYRGGGVPKHDPIFFYSKSSRYFFEPQYVPYSESTQQVMGRTGQRVNKTDIDLARGAHMPDWWTDINSLQTWQRERMGYPTEKPEALLERIITASSREADIVLDPFCGCGTTVTVAERLRRRWVGIDISPTAVNIMKQRLVKATHGRCRPKTIGLPVTEEHLRGLKPFEFQNWVIQRFHGTHSSRKTGDMGIDGYSFMVHDPIQVKQAERVGRNVIDNFETAVERAGKDKGYIVAFSFTRGAMEEVARARWERKLDIKLVRVADLLAPVEEPRVPLSLFPELASVYDLPIATARSADARPSADELIKSDRSAAG